MARFRARVAERRFAAVPDYAALHRWSIENAAAFWEEVWELCEVIGDRLGPALVDPDRMPGARFFPEAGLSFAENLLRRADDAEAIVFRGEDGSRRSLSFAELRRQVAATAASLRGLGVGRGDRVAAVLPNTPEAIVCMLAVASLGAIWASCSPDFGAAAVVDRIGQIEPAVLIATDRYRYGGRVFDVRERAAEIRRALPTVRHRVEVPFEAGTPPPADAIAFESFAASAAPLAFQRYAFNQALYVLFSSGTTGPPKCIVHGAGGTLLQHLKEHRLHTDLRPGDRFFYFTTCAWMMWNWLVSGLASGATLILYDGSPFHPDARRLFDLADEERISILGVSAKFLDAVAKAGLRPRETHDLASVRTVLSTGSPLSPEGFEFVYRHVKRDVCLSSISGGTDLIGCFLAGNPEGPVYAGELQAPALGMDVAVFDAEGREAATGEKGELVCRNAFPSMPLGFWGDGNGERYRRAYFERYPGVWHHGDLVERRPSGGFVVYGRSDATLNPGGVRIGTAEIYRAVERLDDVVEAIAVGQEWQGDVRIVLFVKLREGRELDERLVASIREAIRRGASPRHVPARILQVPEIPRTRSGKIVELAVRDVVHGRPVANLGALANPEALDYFRDRPELRA